MRGGQWQVLRLMRGLRLAGIEPLLRCRTAAPLFLRAESEGFDVRPLNAFILPPCDLIHAHDARSHTIAAFRRTPLVVSRRVAFPIGSRWKYARARHFIAVSRHVAKILESSGIPDERITVVHDGVPLLSPSSGGGKILIPATHDLQKGMALALAAANATGLPFTLSQDLESDLKSARMFVYITHSEGLGSGVLLAMSAGVPAIASDIGGVSEIIGDGENGLLTKNSADAIAAKIMRLANDSDLAGRIAHNARHTIETRFSEAQMVQNTIRVYRRLLNA